MRSSLLTISSLSCIVVLAVSIVCGAHNSPFPHSATAGKEVGKGRGGESGTFPPPILSYHIHVLFIAPDDRQAKEVTILRQKFEQRFAVQAECKWFFGEGGRIQTPCLFPQCSQPDGPFISGNWAVYTPLSLYLPFTQFFSQHRGNLSVMVHPNTGWERFDHTEWALWMGPVWPMDTAIFTYPGPDPPNSTWPYAGCDK